MSFITAKCAHCGADIEADEAKESGYCPHCGEIYYGRSDAEYI